MELIKDRLAHILRAKNLTATQFAEKMEIQPSNVSHLLNGRNKPSLDFLIKLKEIFPEYSFDWIILGKKPITINDSNPVISGEDELKFEDAIDDRVVEFDNIDDEYGEVNEIVEKSIDNQLERKNKQDVKKLIVVYSDNTFEVLTPR
ncbi:MAG: helix-turn-helix transcriptional regulator [Bacteroidales bacterium]|nr:helix-turn-helix transcriptional regulator [Bacteroidales bacterium]